MSVGYNPSIATAGLLACIDAFNKRCYNGTGSTAFDLAGDNNMTIGGSPTFSASQGWTFTNGSTANYMIRNPMTMPTTTCSYEIWCKTTVGGTGIISYASSVADNDFLLFNPSDLSLYTAAAAINSGISITDGAWKQVVRTSNRTTGAEVLYVNGVSQFTTTLAAGTLITSGGSLVFAQEQDSVGGNFDPGQAFGGNIALFRLYNVVLTADQVLQNFNATRGRFEI